MMKPLTKRLMSMLFPLATATTSLAHNELPLPSKLNTSNQGKLAEFSRLLGTSLASVTAKDLREPQGSALEVIVYKASNVPEDTLVEDTSFDVAGMDVGVNVRWLIDELNTAADQLQGRAATWTVLLAYQHQGYVYVYKGSIKGHLVTPRDPSGKRFGFDPIFVPEGSTQTLAELEAAGLKDLYSARALAIQAIKEHHQPAVYPVQADWQGAWQH